MSRNSYRKVLRSLFPIINHYSVLEEHSSSWCAEVLQAEFLGVVTPNSVHGAEDRCRVQNSSYSEVTGHICEHHCEHHGWASPWTPQVSTTVNTTVSTTVSITGSITVSITGSTTVNSTVNTTSEHHEWAPHVNASVCTSGWHHRWALPEYSVITHLIFNQPETFCWHIQKSFPGYLSLQDSHVLTHSLRSWAR